MRIISNSIWKTYRDLFLPLYLSSFLVAIIQSSVLMVIPLFAIELGANTGIAAFIFSLLGMGRFIFNIPCGYLIARIGYKYSMLIGLLLTALIGFFASQLTTTFELGLASFFFGVTATLFLLARLTFITISISSFQRGKIIASMSGVNRGGNILGPIISGLIAAEFGFIYVFFTIGITSLLSIILVFFFKTDKKKVKEEISLGLLEVAPKIFKKHLRIFATAGLAMFLLTFIRNCRDFLMPLWGNFIGLDVDEIGFILGYSAAIEMMMFPITGYTLDNLGRKKVALSCISILSIGLLMVAFTSDYYSLLLVSILIGIGNGLGGGVNLTIGSDLASKVGQIEFLSVWRLVSDSGSFMGPIVIGYIAKISYLSLALTFSSGIGILTSFFIIFFVEETLVKKNKNQDQIKNN